MSLQLKTAVTRNQAGSELYIEFLQATGTYNVSTNPGGFGAPNPERNTLAILFYGLFKYSTQDVEAIPVVYDPLTAASVTIAIDRTKNAHLNHYLFALPIFDIGGTYTDGDVVWDNTTTPLSPTAKKRISGVFQTVTLSSLIEDDEVNQKETNSFVTPDAEAFINELGALRLDLLRKMMKKECECEEYEVARNNYDYANQLLKQAALDFCSGAFGEAELKLEEIFTFQDSYNAQQ